MTDVATFYDATRQWISGGVKDYATMVVIDDVPSRIALKPGMTAQTHIHVGDLSDGVIVPLVAVAQRDDVYYCYVATSGVFRRQQVELGENTENYVEVLAGLAAGDRVALDARMRLDAEHDQQPEDPTPSLASTTP